MLIDVLDNAADFRPRRQKKWKSIIFHHTGIAVTKSPQFSIIESMTENIINWLTKKDENYLSAHFVIKKDGKIVRIVNPDLYEAYHAGVSEIYDTKDQVVLRDLNQHAIGIELIGDGNLGPYTDEQYVSLVNLCAHLVDVYPDIRPNLIVGHDSVSMGRKVDPGKHFDWANFFSRFYLIRIDKKK
jgi:N-acetyl-anhydromuramyl-L-alanine amidase AmpD